MPASSASFSKSSSSSRKKPFLFLSNLLRRKKVLEIDDIMFDREMNHRARSEPSGNYNFVFFFCNYCKIRLNFYIFIRSLVSFNDKQNNLINLSLFKSGTIVNQLFFFLQIHL